jgi:hypothetical protein
MSKVHKNRDAAGIAAAIVRDAIDWDVEDVVEQHSADWERLVSAAAGECAKDPCALSPKRRERILTAFRESLTEAQADQYVALADDDVNQIIKERQAAFELGRQYERAIGGGR